MTALPEFTGCVADDEDDDEELSGTVSVGDSVEDGVSVEEAESAGVVVNVTYSVTLVRVLVWVAGSEVIV
jgi:hypothetical protein